MLYQSFYLEDIPWIGDGVREGRAALAATDGEVRGGTATPLNAGLYLPSLDPAGLAEAIATAREAGASGVSTFEMDGLTDDHLAAIRDATA